MYVIVDQDTRETIEITDVRPKARDVHRPMISVYVTIAEANRLSVPTDEWISDGEETTTAHRVHTPGTIIPANQLTAALSRQDAIRAQVVGILDAAKALNGKAFSALTTVELKSLIQLLCSANGWIDTTGKLDLSDITPDRILEGMGGGAK